MARIKAGTAKLKLWGRTRLTHDQKQIIPNIKLRFNQSSAGGAEIVRAESLDIPSIKMHNTRHRGGEFFLTARKKFFNRIGTQGPFVFEI